ncbi:MAG: RagB/SusD family nutrient uptake outer membrane protein, partial [Flavobacteriaceae bacterium]
MKKIYVFLASCCLLGIFSCSDQLDLQPLDRVTTDAFYKTRADFDGAIFASYSSIQDFWGTSTENLGEFGEFWKISMTITDDVAADANNGTSSRDIDNLILRSSDVPFAAVYTQIYEGIYRANLVINKLEGENELTAEDKTVLGAEAKFLRAWFHFQAMKMFGTPPLALDIKTDINDQARPNASQDELFTAILADFAAAAAGLPASWDSSNTGRVTSWAAKSYIGKVNVWKKDWPTAITAFADVVDNGPYELVPDYEQVFAYNNENNSESIFEIQYGGPFSDDNLWVFDDTHSEDFKASQGTGRGWHWDAGGDAPGGKLGEWAPTQDLVDAFEPGVLSLQTILYQAGDTYFSFDGTRYELPYDNTWSTTSYTLKKYRGSINAVGGNHSPNGQADFNNERWFRFAELKLLYAEALIMGSGDLGIAVQQIQDIRDRAGLTAALAPMNPDPLTAMMQEKRVELALEPHRWFDIVRWGIGPTVF